MFSVVDEIDDNFDTADNNHNFGSWYFIFVLEQWLLLSNTSLFLMFAVVNNNKIDNDFDTADNDDGNDGKKNPSTIDTTALKGMFQPTTNRQPQTFFQFFWSCQRQLTCHCFVEWGFIFLCHGCNEQ